MSTRPTVERSTINPGHYRDHPSGIECIEVTRHLCFRLGNAVKYVWRAPDKNRDEDLNKAAWYIRDLLSAAPSRVDIEDHERFEWLRQKVKDSDDPIELRRLILFRLLAAPVTDGVTYFEHLSAALRLIENAPVGSMLPKVAP